MTCCRASRERMRSLGVTLAKKRPGMECWHRRTRCTALLAPSQPSTARASHCGARTLASESPTAADIEKGRWRYDIVVLNRHYPRFLNADASARPRGLALARTCFREPLLDHGADDRICPTLAAGGGDLQSGVGRDIRGRMLQSRRCLDASNSISSIRLIAAWIAWSWCPYGPRVSPPTMYFHAPLEWNTTKLTSRCLPAYLMAL